MVDASTKEVAMNRFADMYLCTFEWSDEDIAAQKLADRYESECESFDRIVCRHKNDRGVAIPVSNGERVAVNKNAIKVWRKIKSECEIAGIDFNLVREFIKKGA